MSKYSDKKVGRAKRIPFIKGEDAHVRHHRRKHFNLELQAEFRKWCDSQDAILTIRNEGHHWTIEFPNAIFEWWPSSAKLVQDKKWNKSLHVHDIDQLKTQIYKIYF